MTTMTVIDELVAANAVYAETFENAGLPAPPARKVAILTCMDARITPLRALGLELGDAHVIRNAGGRAEDAIRSLAISHKLLGTREVMVIHHTNCGMLGLANDSLRASFAVRQGADAGAAAAAIDFMGFDDLESSVLEDIDLLKKSPLIPSDIIIRGFVYDVETGRLKEILAT